MDDDKSMVSRCDATTCRFNDDMNCTAGPIEVSPIAIRYGPGSNAR